MYLPGALPGTGMYLPGALPGTGMYLAGGACAHSRPVEGPRMAVDGLLEDLKGIAYPRVFNGLNWA